MVNCSKGSKQCHIMAKREVFASGLTSIFPTWGERVGFVAAGDGAATFMSPHRTRGTLTCGGRGATALPGGYAGWAGYLTRLVEKGRLSRAAENML